MSEGMKESVGVAILLYKERGRKDMGGNRGVYSAALLCKGKCC